MFLDDDLSINHRNSILNATSCCAHIIFVQVLRNSFFLHGTRLDDINCKKLTQVRKWPRSKYYIIFGCRKTAEIDANVDRYQNAIKSTCLIVKIEIAN